MPIICGKEKSLFLCTNNVGCQESKNLIKQLNQVFESAFQGDFSVQVLAYAFQGQFLCWAPSPDSFPITHSLFFLL